MSKPVESLSDLTVLAVDDVKEALDLLRLMLKDIGVNQTFTASDGKEALDFLGECENMIHVIICDWNMPRVTGLEILRQVRTVDPDIPFLMATGVSDNESVVVAKSDGVTGYLVKPYSTDQLGKKTEIYPQDPEGEETEDESAPCFLMAKLK